MDNNKWSSHYHDAKLSIYMKKTKGKTINVTYRHTFYYYHTSLSYTFIFDCSPIYYMFAHFI